MQPILTMWWPWLWADVSWPTVTQIWHYSLSVRLTSTLLLLMLLRPYCALLTLSQDPWVPLIACTSFFILAIQDLLLLPDSPRFPVTQCHLLAHLGSRAHAYPLPLPRPGFSDTSHNFNIHTLTNLVLNTIFIDMTLPPAINIVEQNFSTTTFIVTSP